MWKMADVKTYQIIINGLTESISAVDSLNNQLDTLDKKIADLQGKAVNVSVNFSVNGGDVSPSSVGDVSLSSGGGGVSRTSELSDEDKLLKQIEATQSKINQADMADYKILLDKKQELKELVKEQKSMTAEARLSEGAYDNTMLGMKQHLADIKAAMQTVNLNDTDTFEKLTKDANELNAKLLEIEKSYGQFGRQVGHYEIVAEGFKGLKIDIGGISEEFENARQAYMTLKKEMQTLSTKQDMGIISEEETERLKSLIPTVKQLESSIADAGKPMDALMDNMQSFVALAQAGKGLAAFFGLEGTGIDETIKNLVALQNAMQGLQTIQKQLQTGEGLGKYFANANNAIDSFSKKLFGVKKATTEVTTASKAQAAATSTVATASKGAATAEVAQTTATAGLTVAEKQATFAAKALSTALKTIGIGLVLAGITFLVDGIKSAVSWIKSLYTVSEEEYKAVAGAVEAVRKNTQELMSALEQNYGDSMISKVQSLTEQFHLQAEAVKNIVEQLDELKKREQGSIASKLEDYGNLYWDTTNRWIKTWRKNDGDFSNSSVRGAGEGLYLNYLAKVKKAIEEADKAWEDYSNGVEGSTERLQYAQQALENLKGEAQHSDILRTVQYNLETFFPQEAFRTGAESIVETLNWTLTKFHNFNDDVTDSQEQLRRYLMSDEERALDDANKTYKEMLDAAQGNAEQIQKVEEKHAEKVEKIHNSFHKTTITNTKKYGSNLVSAEETIQSLRIRLMKDSLIQRLNQLEKERRETLSKVKGTEQQKLEIEKLYNQLRLDALNDYINSVKEQYDSLKKSVVRTEKELDIALVENLLAETSNTTQQLEMNKAIQATIISLAEYKELVKEIGGLDKQRLDYATAFNNNLRTSDLGDNEGLQTFLNTWVRGLDKSTQKELVDYFDSIEGTTTEKAQAYYKKIMSMFEDQYKNELRLVREFGIQYEQNLADSVKKRLQYEREYRNNNLEELLAYRKEQLEDEKYLAKLRKDQADQEALDAKEAIEKQYNDQVSALTRTISELQAFGKKATAQQKKDLENATAELENIQSDYLTTRAQAEINYQRQLIRNEEEFKNNEKQLEINYGKDISSIASKYYTEQLQNYRDFTTKFNAEMAKQPIINDWGIIDLPKTKANYKELQSAITESLNSVMEDKKRLNKEFSDGIITPEVYNQTLRELNDTETDFKDKAKTIKENLADIGVEFYSTINEWLQQIGQAANSIMSSLSEITSSQYEKMIDQQQKYIDEYSDLLDKQKDMTQKYADAVDNIEDELSSARGDRRQHLIDQLNAEIAAQRASLAEEKRIEKEKEKAEKRKTELEYKQALAEKKMSVAQAALNAVMAVSMAAVNKWPIPAIPMIALATAVGAAQVAAANSQYIPKPTYAKGGLLEGPSHQNGGIPVYGGKAELEGLEYVVNKRTTTQNLSLLEYINSKKKRIDLSDMVEFFNDKPRATIKNIRSKFADGGVLTTPNVDISNFSDRTIIVKDEGIYEVSVVDINRKQEQVKNIQVLAGIGK